MRDYYAKVTQSGQAVHVASLDDRQSVYPSSRRPFRRLNHTTCQSSSHKLHTRTRPSINTRGLRRGLRFPWAFLSKPPSRFRPASLLSIVLFGVYVAAWAEGS